MWVRLAFLKPAQGRLDDLRALFHYQIGPAVATRSGHGTALLLEPESDSEPVIVYLSWSTRNALQESLTDDILHQVRKALDPMLTEPVREAIYEATQ